MPSHAFNSKSNNFCKFWFRPAEVQIRCEKRVPTPSRTHCLAALSGPSTRPRCRPPPQGRPRLGGGHVCPGYKEAPRVCSLW